MIRHAVWLYFRFTLSMRDVEALLAERGTEVSREAVRCWAVKFGPLFARNLRRRQPRPTGRWRLDEMTIRIGDSKRWLWRAVDDEGVVLDMLVQSRRDKKAALRLICKVRLKETNPRSRDGAAQIGQPILSRHHQAETSIYCGQQHASGEVAELKER